MGEGVQHEVLQQRPDVVGDGSEVTELGIDHAGVVSIQHDAARVQVGMDEGLRVRHVRLFHLRDLDFERGIGANGTDLLLDEGVALVLGGGHVRVRVDEVFLELVQVRVDEPRLHVLPGGAGQAEVRRAEKDGGQEGRDVLDKPGKPLAGNERLPHHLVPAEVLHDHERHLLVVVVDLGRQAGAQGVVQPQRLCLEAHPFAGQGPRFPRDAQVRKGLLDHHGPDGRAPVFHDEHLVEVAVPDLGDSEPRIEPQPFRDGGPCAKVPGKRAFLQRHVSHDCSPPSAMRVPRHADLCNPVGWQCRPT